MDKLLKSVLVTPALLTACTVIGSTAPQPFVWPAAWSDAQPGEAKYGGIFRDAYPQIGTFNPFTDQDLGGPQRRLAEGTGLFRRDPVSRRSVPYMAAGAPQISADGRVYTVRLRPGMRFSDGQPVTAQDFVTTWKIHTDKAVKSALYGDFFNGDQPVTLRALDASTLQVTFPVPMATAEEILSFAPWPDHLFGPVYARGGAKAVAALWGRDVNPATIVTAGTWTLAQNDNREDGHILFRKNPYWGEWNRDAQGRALPYLDGIELNVVSPDAPMLTHFLAGKTDWAVVPSADAVKTLQSAMTAGKLNAELLLNVSPRNSMSYLVFNWNKASDLTSRRCSGTPSSGRPSATCTTARRSSTTRWAAWGARWLRWCRCCFLTLSPPTCPPSPTTRLPP
ncbi:extracellular solute-binding protein, family 5 Middle [Deinococcus reticulitermitis]|uniref:Extracellular solute-binding protein, family 5 Middle n=1 Tax=Deinococcus reticulitermitis TaxID=856736 RepID=A0A1H7D6M4_9DEIO|nr:extracellular solute-binding protein, family 5 Middle [Deinococcus reticulitermitis]